MLLRLAAALLGLLTMATAVQAADLPITAFTGKWQGTAISESDISVNFKLTSRDIGVEVRPDGNGFTIVWITVQRQKGDPNNPREVLKSTEMSFDQVRAGVWQASGNADPLASQAPYAWAHITGNTLTINALLIYADGRHEIQMYRRSLSGSGMALEFTRTVEGEPVRRASGRLIKIAK
jgi:hypothetical protein